MPIVSYQFIKILSSLNYNSYQELLAIINADCAKKEIWRIFSYGMIVCKVWHTSFVYLKQLCHGWY